MTLIELLAEVAGIEVALRRETPVLSAAVVTAPAGRRVLALERTYREGIVVLLDPSDEEVEEARNGNLWTLWNAKRAQNLSSVI